VRHRVALLAIPLLLGSALALSSPAQTRAADGMTETGVTTYEVLPSKAQIKVTVVLSDHNTKPNSGGYYYYWAATEMAEELQGGAITATSNGGKVKQKVIETGNYYRLVELDYPPVLYGQTRVVTATYSIPAGPKASGGFRALTAYASFCAVGNGVDSGSIQVVVPDGFELWVNAGEDLSLVSDKNGKQVYTTGTAAQPYKLFTCVNADKPGALVSTPITAGQQSVTVQSWPEDASWNSIVTADVTADIPALENLTGLTMDETPTTTSPTFPRPFRTTRSPTSSHTSGSTGKPSPTNGCPKVSPASASRPPEAASTRRARAPVPTLDPASRTSISG
jgi:hypothetical protein